MLIIADSSHGTRLEWSMVLESKGFWMVPREAVGNGLSIWCFTHKFHENIQVRSILQELWWAVHKNCSFSDLPHKRIRKISIGGAALMQPTMLPEQKFRTVNVAQILSMILSKIENTRKLCCSNINIKLVLTKNIKLKQWRNLHD